METATTPSCQTPDDRAAVQPPLDELDRKILTQAQVDFPISRWPYEVLGARLDCEGQEVLRRVRRLCEAGVIRRLGGVFSPSRLGYVSTLVAAKVSPGRLGAVAAEVSREPGVTHNYAREHEYNLWFTLTARSAAELDAAVLRLGGLEGVEGYNPLPATAAYKTSAVFVLDGSTPPSAPAPAGPWAGAVRINDGEKALIRLVQGSLPLEARPLVSLAERWGRPVEILIVCLRHWLAAGLMRRFGAVLSHRRVGMSANGLALFRAHAEGADRAGAALAGRPEVSHCYLRRGPEGWRWNLFAMFHGADRQAVRALVAELAGREGLGSHEVLFSTVEYKKTSMRFFDDD